MKLPKPYSDHLYIYYDFIQEPSLKSQNATLEKKQHDSWVTVRQESRKLTEAQNEMQTLRARLTVAETKLAEKTVEIDNLMQENQTMKETMDRINNHQILKSDNTSKYFHIFLLQLYCIFIAF